MKFLFKNKYSFYGACAVITILPFNYSHAQGMNNNAWSPNPSNRASIAALIRQVEQGEASGSIGSAASANGVTQLICGTSSGDGGLTSATSQANSSCIIMNNSSGDLNVNQDSIGDQSADAVLTATTTIDETINEAE